MIFFGFFAVFCGFFRRVYDSDRFAGNCRFFAVLTVFQVCTVFYGVLRVAVSFVGCTVLAVWRQFPFFCSFFAIFQAFAAFYGGWPFNSFFRVFFTVFSVFRFIAEFCSFNRFSGCFC